jgi:two-component system, NarL family, sensor histidine kinase UhpB
MAKLRKRGDKQHKRNKAKAKLHAVPMEWDDIFQAIGHPSLILGSDHRIIACNKAITKLTGKSTKYFVGRKCYDVFHEKNKPPCGCPMDKLLGTGCFETVEMEMEALDRTFLVSCTPVFDKSGALARIIHIATDVTERKQAEEKLIANQKQLKALAAELSYAEEHERRRIAIGIHDSIGQKLAMAKLKLQFIKGSVPEQIARSAIDSACNMMDEIIDDTRSLVFELSNPILYEIGLEQAIGKLLKNEIQHKGSPNCQFISAGDKIELDEDTKVVLFKAVRELLINIVKHAGAKNIKVGISKHNNEVEVTVEDDGSGFDISKLGPPSGTKGGFGLFNIRERLEYMGGQLEINSRPGKGTRIVMTAPISKFQRGRERVTLYEGAHSR